MPDILIHVANIAALASIQPLDKNAPLKAWKFRRCPYDRGLYTFLIRGNHAVGGLTHAISIGTTEVVQESATQNGGTPGVTPVPQTTPAHQFYAMRDDEIVLEINEKGNVATTDVDIWANVEPG